MKSRIIIIDLNEEEWFDKSIDMANDIVKKRFIPSEYALELFDQKKSFEKLSKLFISNGK